MTRREFTITSETKNELERERGRLEAEITRLREQLQLVTRKLEAIPLFLSDGISLSDVNGTQAKVTALRPPEPPRIVTGDDPTAPDAAQEVSVPEAVKQAVARRGRLEAVEIRDAIIAAGVPRERLGATYSYLYTVLGRMVDKGTIQRRGKKYQLPTP